MKFFNYPCVLHGDKKLIDQIFGLLDEAGRNHRIDWNKDKKQYPQCNYLLLMDLNSSEYHTHDCNSITKNLITLTEANLSEICKQLQLNTVLC